MREDLTLITVLMDASGSMDSIKGGVISGVNEFIVEQKKLPGEVVFNLIQFDSTWGIEGRGMDNLRYKEIYSFRNLKEVSPVTEYNYVPQGGTPLIAAMCTAIDHVGAKLAEIPEYARPSKVVFVTITDGQENTSDLKKYSKELLQQKTKHQQDVYNWKFIYLGANQDAFAEAQGMGMLAKNTSNFNYSSGGVMRGLASASAVMSSYRQGISQDVDMTAYQKANELTDEEILKLKETK